MFVGLIFTIMSSHTAYKDTSWSWSGPESASSTSVPPVLQPTRESIPHSYSTVMSALLAVLQIRF